MSDIKISQLPAASSIQSTDVGVLVSSNDNFKFSFATLLSFLATNLSTGATITFGTVLPSNSSGKNGDVFVKTDSQQFAQKIAGTWTVVYTVTATGAMDGTVLYGAGVPSSATGNDGDTYINTLNGVFYKKASGAWSQQFSMATGPAGPRGNSILNGSGSPANSLGQNGDFYLDIDTETIYGPRASGVWPMPGTLLKGSSGNSVLNGTTNPNNSLGNNGDFYINTSTFVFFGPKAGGVWPAGASLLSTGIPTGGNTNQVLKKKSSTNFDIDWEDVSLLFERLSADIIKTTVSGVDYFHIDLSAEATCPAFAASLMVYWNVDTTANSDTPADYVFLQAGFNPNGKKIEVGVNDPATYPNQKLKIFIQ